MVSTEHWTTDYYITNTYEAMPYACRSWSKAVGARPGTVGSIQNEVNLGNLGIDKKHSAQFNYNIQRLSDFYSILVKELGLDVPTPRQ
jgi:hypothetical protein